MRLGIYLSRELLEIERSDRRKVILTLLPDLNSQKHPNYNSPHLNFRKVWKAITFRSQELQMTTDRAS